MPVFQDPLTTSLARFIVSDDEKNFFLEIDGKRIPIKYEL